MRVLITGGAGFVGANTAKHFLEKGWDVSIFDNLSRETAVKNIQMIKTEMPSVEIINGNIIDANSIKQSAEGKDFIVHLAAQVAVTTSVANPRLDFEVNALGTFNVLEAARKNDCGVIYASTNKVYGDNVNKIPIEEFETRYDFSGEFKGKGVAEDFPINAKEHSPYGCSKLAGDVYVQDYGHVYGLPTVVNRMSCIYGPNQYGTEDQGWLAHFIISALKRKPITIFGDGKQVRDVLFINDLSRLYALEIENCQKIKGEVFNVGGGYENTISLIELLKIMKNFGLEVEIKYSDWRPADQKVYYSDISKLFRILKWRPEIRSEEGIRRLYEWARKRW